MFPIKLPKLPYQDPWILPLHQRMAMLSAGKHRVAYFYEEPNNSTFRYRAYNMAQVLNDGNNHEVSASYFFLEDLWKIEEISSVADTLVVCRSRYCHRVNQLITKFRNRNKPVLFDVDDLVFDPRYVHLIMNTLDQDLEKPNPWGWDHWFSYIARMGETLRLCDAAITTNQYLADRIQERVGCPVSVVPNFINKEQLNFSEQIFTEKKASDFARNKKISLGYFSGSPSHNLDYAIVTSALEELLETDDRVEVVVVGYINAGASLARFGNRVRYEPFQDYVNLQRLIATVEFNLMPLQSNVFTNCKSELKYFEAAIVGTISVASPSYTYSRAIKNGETGYHAKAHEWLSVLREAIDNMPTYSLMAEKAYKDAHLKYTWATQRECILKALGII